MISFKSFLSELHNIKRFYGTESIADIFKSFGWRELGSGAFASVYEIPGKPYVAKVWTADKSYELFLKYILMKENRNNPFFPKVFGRLKTIPAVHLRSRKEDVVKIVLLEKLEQISNVSWSIFEDVLDGKALSTEQIYYAKDLIDIDLLRETLEAMEQYKSQWLPSTWGDIHSGNVMERPDGSIVITDPWALGTDMDELGRRRMEKPIYSKPRYLEK